MQNIETVKAFNTFLDATIISSTQKILNKPLPTPSLSPSTGELDQLEKTGDVQDAAALLPTLDTLEVE